RPKTAARPTRWPRALNPRGQPSEKSVSRRWRKAKSRHSYRCGSCGDGRARVSAGLALRARPRRSSTRQSAGERSPYEWGTVRCFCRRAGPTCRTSAASTPCGSPGGATWWCASSGSTTRRRPGAWHGSSTQRRGFGFRSLGPCSSPPTRTRTTSRPSPTSARCSRGKSTGRRAVPATRAPPTRTTWRGTTTPTPTSSLSSRRWRHDALQATCDARRIAATRRVSLAMRLVDWTCHVWRVTTVNGSFATRYVSSGHTVPARHRAFLGGTRRARRIAFGEGGLGIQATRRPRGWLSLGPPYEISRRRCRPSRVVHDASLHIGASRATPLHATPRSGRLWRGHIRHCNTSKGAMCHGAFGCLPKMGHGGSLLFPFSRFKVGSASKSGDNKTFPSEAENAVSKTPGFFDGVGLSETLYSGPEFRAGMYRCL
ncbi:unnamed protein product, partial [Ixodes pacificus]